MSPEERRRRDREAKERFREKNPDYFREWLYGISPEDIARMTAEQEGCCYLCGEPLDFEKKRGFSIDHDHSCCRGNKSCGSCIRGIACGTCNSGIAYFGDDPDRMRRVADNLEMANRRVRGIPRLQGELFSTTRGSDTAERDKP